MTYMRTVLWLIVVAKMFTAHAFVANIHYIEDPSEETVCMDGSKPAFYLRKGSPNNKWIIFFEGGGWCFNEKECLRRRSVDLGSSANYASGLQEKDLRYFYLRSSNNKGKFVKRKPQGPLFGDWNLAFIKYCDGSSFAGNAVVTTSTGSKIHFKGQLIRDSVIRTLLRDHGMRNASHVVLSGCSAGALAVYLGIDHMADIIRHHSIRPSMVIRGLADSGFFLPHSAASGRNDYDSSMRRVFLFANMSAGANKACLAYHSNDSSGGGLMATTLPTTPVISRVSQDERERSHCAFASNLYPHIASPTFTVHSQYDSWQAWNVLGDGDNVTALMEFGGKLVSLLQSSMQSIRRSSSSSSSSAAVSSPSTVTATMHAAFVDSCWYHCSGCPYSLDAESVGLSSLPPSMGRVQSTQQLIQAWMTWTEEVELSQLSGQKSGGLERNQSPMFVFQNFSYPCKQCCQCFYKS